MASPEMREKRIAALSDSKQKLAEKLLEANQFPVPEVLVETQLDRKIERTLGQLLSQGIDPRQTQVDWRKVREDARPEAEKEVRVALVLSRVADAEKIDLSEEEVDDVFGKWRRNAT